MGAIVGSCRGYCRLAYVHMDKSRHKQVATLLLAFCRMCRQHLRRERDPTALTGYITEADIDAIMSFGHRPQMILRRLEVLTLDALASKYADEAIVIQLAADFREYLNGLSSAMGNCERIVKSPAPYFYSINTSRFLSLYLFTLPLAIIPYLQWYTIPTMAAISWCFIAIQEIGHLIEDPFNTDARAQLIPMDELTSVVQANMAELLDGVLPASDVPDTPTSVF